MTIFTGTSGDDALFGIAGDDTYQLGGGNDTITYNATVDGSGVLTWGYGIDTIISTDGGVVAPEYDKIVFGFSSDYLWGRKVGNNFEISIYAHVVTATIDPGAVDQVGKLIIVDAFSPLLADRLSRIEASDGFFYEAIATPVADTYGNIAIYKNHTPGPGVGEYEEWYVDINNRDTQHISTFADGSAVVQYFDAGLTLPWYRTDLTYLNYGTAGQVLMRSEQYNDDGSINVTVPGTSGNDLIVGNSGNDILNGAAGDDNIFGLAGNDTINGGAGNDGLLGGAGADTVIGGTGDDTMDGGLQSDAINFSDYNTLNYASTTSALTINTALGTASSSTDGNDTFVNFYRIRGGSGDDTIIGNSDLHFEQFEGGAGNDRIDGGAITDTLNGTNANRLTYQNAAAGVTVDLLAGTATGGAGTDTLLNFNQVRGSNFNDTLQGSNTTVLTEQFEGGRGDDSIDGRGGFDIVRFSSSTAGVTANLATGTATGTDIGTDTFVNVEGLFGSDFNDILTGGLAANGVTVSDGLIEVFRGGAGNDTIDGGQGYDRADYTTGTSGVSVILNDAADGSANDGQGGTDVLRNIEGVRGSDFNDSISGNSAANKLEGLSGNDQLRGGAGNDTLLGGEGSDYLTGGSGDDVLNGGNGIDTADYFFSDTSAGIVVNLVAGTATGGGGSDTLVGIENVNGSDFNDTITGDAGNNFIDGRGGDDTLLGGAGADNLSGGAGNDILDGGVVLDHTGNTDWNFVSYTSSTGSVSINLSGITGDGSVGSGTATGDASVGVDTLINISNMSGSNFNDSITGSSALIFENFEGGAGNDALDGGAMTDTLNGDNTNRVSYFNTLGAGVTVDFIAGTAVGAAGSNAGSDTIVNFTQILGSSFNDILLGSDRTDFTEQFEGRQGNDTIDGRGGFDLARYGNATASVNVNLLTGIATGAGTGTDTLLHIEGVVGSTFDDILTGGNSASGVTVSDGLSEIFRGGAGNDTIDGGQGYDRTDYTSATAGVTVKLNGALDGTASDGQGGIDILRNIEGVRGSDFDDTLTGSDSATFESFEGIKGNDTINGLGGIDRVDYRNSRAGVTVNLTSGTASDGEGGTDTLLNIENVRGSRDFNDTITGSAADNRLEGLGGNDTINGGAGFDTAVFSGLKSGYTITRSAGSITVSGADGVDVLTGIEKLTFSDASVFLKLANNDFDGDGKSDILWRNTATGADAIWKGGDGATVQTVTAVANQDWKVVGTGDFNGDGKADILWRNSATGSDTIWKGGDSAAVQAVTAVANQDWKVVGTGDFDGDGKADILWRNSVTGADTIWKSGDSATVQAVASVANLDWKVTATGDFDADGKADILWRNIATGADSIWKGGDSATVQTVAAVGNLDWSMLDGLETGDLLSGGTGNNTLYGTVKGDLLFGGAGNDVLTGGLGQDLFRFINASQGNDTITDFSAGADKLQLVSSGFGNLALGGLAAGNFVSGAAPVATQASAQFLYNTGSGQLSFDADGNGAGTAVNLVTLVGSPALTAADFLLVA
jgi:Ca2+-binding RTX toxin-like protein